MSKKSNHHNSNHYTNMERMWSVFHVVAGALGVEPRVGDAEGRDADLSRMAWRLQNGKPLVKESNNSYDRQQWLDTYTRKTSGVPFSKWSETDRDAVRRFVEALSAYGTNGW